MYCNTEVLVSENALNAARELAAGMDPTTAASHSGARYEGDASHGRFMLRFLGDEVAISFPEFDFDAGCSLPPHVRALLVHYLARSAGAEPVGPWQAFADLPDGRFYARAFQGYTGDALARRLADRTGLDARVAVLGGRTMAREELATNADGAWFVPGLPRVPVAVVWWDADDEFPARAELLFDASASSHLPTDGCAVLGSWLTTRLVAEVERSER